MTPADEVLRQRVARLVAEEIAPALDMDATGVEVVGCDRGVVQVRLERHLRQLPVVGPRRHHGAGGRVAEAHPGGGVSGDGDVARPVIRAFTAPSYSSDPSSRATSSRAAVRSPVAASASTPMASRRSSWA